MSDLSKITWLARVEPLPGPLPETSVSEAMFSPGGLIPASCSCAPSQTASRTSGLTWPALRPLTPAQPGLPAFLQLLRANNHGVHAPRWEPEPSPGPSQPPTRLPPLPLKSSGGTRQYHCFCLHCLQGQSGPASVPPLPGCLLFLLLPRAMHAGRLPSHILHLGPRCEEYFLPSPRSPSWELSSSPLYHPLDVPPPPPVVTP